MARPEDIEITVLISLPSRTDRRDAFFAGLPDDWPFPPPQVQDGVDGRVTGTPPGWAGTPGSWGCLLAHRRTLENLLSAGAESALILEDDCVFSEGFTPAARRYMQNLPSDWEQAYLGGQHLLPPDFVTDQAVRCRNTNRTHAYMVRSQTAMKKLLAHLYRDDHRQARKQGHFDYWLGEMHEFGLIRAYAPTVWLAGQRPSKSDVTARPPLPLPQFWNTRRLQAARRSGRGDRA